MSAKEILHQLKAELSCPLWCVTKLCAISCLFMQEMVAGADICAIAAESFSLSRINFRAADMRFAGEPS
jgi:hypothetical protein